MSIIKQDNEIIVVLGVGDIVVSAASTVKDGLNTELVFSNATMPHGINEVCEESIGIPTNELAGPVVRIQFNKLESLQVVEKMLIAVKTDMLKAMEGEKSRKMKDKIYNYQIIELGPIDEDQVTRLARCWNILRTMTDAQLESLERQVDAVAAEVVEEFVDVHIGPSLPF